jgi:hypothetical protein
VYSEDSGTRGHSSTYLAGLWLAVAVPVPDSGSAGREIHPLPGFRGLVYAALVGAGLGWSCLVDIQSRQYSIAWCGWLQSCSTVQYSREFTALWVLLARLAGYFWTGEHGLRSMCMR